MKNVRLEIQSHITTLPNQLIGVRRMAGVPRVGDTVKTGSGAREVLSVTWESWRLKIGRPAHDATVVVR